MPAVNGVTTPPAAHDSQGSTTSATKRKRSESQSQPQTNGVEHAVATHIPQDVDKRMQALQADVLTVLEKYDTQPSILDCTLPEDRLKSSSDEPSSKRTKFSDAESIRRKLEAREYPTLEALQDDVGVAASEMLKPLMAKEAAIASTPLGTQSQLSPAESRHWAGILAFQKVLKRMAEHEAWLKKQGAEVDGQNNETQVNGVKKEEGEDDIDIFSNGRKVLTVYAAAPQPKQLFSSFQQPLHDNVSVKTLDAEVDVTMPLRESGLPNMLSVTTIPQLPVDDTTESNKNRPTFGDRFAPPRTIRLLDPPQPSKQTTTKGNTLEFVSSDDLVRRTRRDSYNWCGSRLVVGQWLGYGHVEPIQEPTSPEAKRKQRDRALSTGEARPPISKADLLAMERAREDALFRKVYSSFAPTYDDTGAIVPKEVKNDMWWSKIGRQRAQRALLIDPDLSAFDEPVQSQAAKASDEDEVETFKKAVEEFDPESMKAGQDESTQEEKDTDALLEDISDLMETLYSFQLIRNMSVSKPQTREAQEITKKSIGTPSAPSEAESEVYKTLRVQLAMLVSTLPPYLVARLDGDRLKELNVSGDILIETNDDRGIMEEDQITRLAKHTALSSAVGPQTAPRPESARSYSNYPASSQYNRTPATQGPMPRPSPQNYFPHQQQQNRPAPLPYQRPATGVQPYAGNYPGARPGYQTPAQQYPQSAPRPGGYGQGGNSYLQQLQQIAGNQVRPGSSQYYGSTPQAGGPNRGYAAQTPVPNYQRPSSTAPMYYPQSPHQRTASPLNAGTIGPPSYGNGNRQPYATPGGQARSQYIPPGGSGPQYQSPISAGFTPNIPNANADQQSAMRAQLAAQAQARLAAAAPHQGITPNRQSSGTPQPAYGQGTSLNGTPMLAQRT